MKTSVIMKRRLFDGEISQNSKTGYFSATDLYKSGNVWRIANRLQPLKLADWVQLKSNKEFIQKLEEEIGQPAKISGRGRGIHTWVHPYLFIDMALSINPSLKIQVYEWIYDELIKYRNRSGDSYKKMAGALYLTISNKANFTALISEVANRIKVECGVSDWQEATEEQLKLRDKIHEYIALLSDIIRDKSSLIDLAIQKAKDEERGR